MGLVFKQSQATKFFFAENALEIARENNINIVLNCGTVIDDNVQPCRAVINREEYSDMELLKSSIEQADSRSIITMGYKNFVILSNDTDAGLSAARRRQQFGHFETPSKALHKAECN